MLPKATQRSLIIISLLIVVAMGFLFKFYSGPAHQWFNNYGAALFYEIFWCLFVFLLVRNQKAVIQIPLWSNSKHQSIKEETDGSFTVHLKSPPVDGKANEELIKILAKRFDVSKSKIIIKSGLSSRQKLIEIDTDF